MRASVDTLGFVKKLVGCGGVLRGSAALCGFSAMALMTLAIPAHAGLVTNGSFEDTGTLTTGFNLPLGNTSDLPGWQLVQYSTDSPIACVMFPTNPVDCGAGTPQLWTATTSPDGGNFFVMDTDNPALLEQTISGLIVGQYYDVAFYQAGAEFKPNIQAGDPTFASWLVGFGSSSLSSGTNFTPPGGFGPWIGQTLRFKADSTTELLSFLAVGGPGGLPPAIALDDVNVTFVPEPGTYALMGAALVLVGIARKRLNKRS